MASFVRLFGKELVEYADTLIDGEIILNRTDAIRQIIIDHRDKLRGIK